MSNSEKDSSKQTTDRLYAESRGHLSPFQFDEQVARVFNDMIRRSVPGYGMTLDMIGVITQHYAQPNTHCYDLGCSLGASTLAMRHYAPGNCRIIAIDNSEAMIEQCETHIAQDQSSVEVELRCEDLLNTKIENASMVVMNFTLQFIGLEERPKLLSRIQKGLIPGGALVLSEKLQFEDDAQQETLTELYHDFKKTQGYSELEVAQKRSALENVLIPETLTAHRERLLAAGFSQVIPWFQCFSFTSLLAIK